MTLGEYLDQHPVIKNKYYLSSGVNPDWQFNPITQVATKRNGTKVKILWDIVSVPVAKKHGGKDWKVFQREESHK